MTDTTKLLTTFYAASVEQSMIGGDFWLLRCSFAPEDSTEYTRVTLHRGVYGQLKIVTVLRRDLVYGVALLLVPGNAQDVIVVNQNSHCTGMKKTEEWGRGHRTRHGQPARNLLHAVWERAKATNTLNRGHGNQVPWQGTGNRAQGTGHRTKGKRQRISIIIPEHPSCACARFKLLVRTHWH